MPDLRPLETILNREPIAEGAVFEMAIDPERLGTGRITTKDIAVFNELVSEFEIPALRAFTTIDRRQGAAERLDIARQEFGNQGFQLKAALLGSTAAKAYFETKNYIMAEAEAESALWHDANAVEMVKHSTVWNRQRMPVNHPVRANFPDLADPHMPKLGVKDSSSHETMHLILKSHLALRVRILEAAHVATMKRLHGKATSRLHDSAKDIYGRTVIKNNPPTFSLGGSMITRFGDFDSRY